MTSYAAVQTILDTAADAIVAYKAGTLEVAALQTYVGTGVKI